MNSPAGSWKHRREREREDRGRGREFSAWLKPSSPSLCHLLFPSEPSQCLTALGPVVSLRPSPSASLSSWAAGQRGQGPYPPGRVTGPKPGRELGKRQSPGGTQVPTRQSWGTASFPTQAPVTTTQRRSHSWRRRMESVICSPNPPFSLLAQILKCPGIFPHGMGETTCPSWKGIILLDTLLDRNTFCGVTCKAPGDIFLGQTDDMPHEQHSSEHARLLHAVINTAGPILGIASLTKSGDQLSRTHKITVTLT